VHRADEVVVLDVRLQVSQLVQVGDPVVADFL
jgi:hypothetical protein